MLNLGLGAKFHLRCETWLQLVHICIKAADVNASSCSFNTDVSLGLGGDGWRGGNVKGNNNGTMKWKDAEDLRKTTKKQITVSRCELSEGVLTWAPCYVHLPFSAPPCRLPPPPFHPKPRCFPPPPSSTCNTCPPIHPTPDISILQHLL